MVILRRKSFGESDRNISLLGFLEVLVHIVLLCTKYESYPLSVVPNSLVKPLKLYSC